MRPVAKLNPKTTFRLVFKQQLPNLLYNELTRVGYLFDPVTSINVRLFELILFAAGGLNH